MRVRTHTGLALFCLLAFWVCRAEAQVATAAQGKVVALNGRVEHTPAVKEQWSAARMLQPLLIAERVRTLEASRASILFIDETQVKLNAGAVLTIREVRRDGAAASSMELQRGEAWFRTKNPRSGLTVTTPAAAAAIRGTEINVRVGAQGESVLTVVEGSVEFFNPQGSIVVNAGEEGTALPGQPPTKRVILNPEDAVQWALYYPLQVAYQDLSPTGTAAPGFDRLRSGDVDAALKIFASTPGDPWAALGASMAYVASGDLDRARQALASPMNDRALESERRTQLAAIALANGDAASARRELETVLSGDPAALRPLVLLSSIALRQNRSEEALQLAQRALAAHPTSVGALVAASEAAQSRFDLDAARRYLDRALEIDPRDLHALVNRARVRFGTDDTEGARDDADRAAAIAPDDAQVRSLRGFIRLADGDVTAARADFEAAATADPEFAEPHLGLGLAFFRENRVEQGLEEMLTATLLEPKVALYQSYLGKAYYQARRFPEGLSALATAKRLDPNDPTPWLYASFFLRDQNQQVDALNELRHAIVLNDYRAVYRSRSLLDRDLATKNVSLAEVYRQLGFEAWGAFEALNSLETDLTNSSAHLFLAETYGGLPDRTEALSSELLQYFLYAPVNRNSFNSFAEYTALLEQPRRQLDVTTEFGLRERGFANVNHRGGNTRFAHVAFFQGARQNGTRLSQVDERYQGFFQGKLSLTSRDDIFLNYTGVREEYGAPETTTRIFGENDLPNAIILRQFTTSPDRTLTNTYESHEVTLGVKHAWRAGSVFTAAARYQNLEQTLVEPRTLISCNGLNLGQIEPFSSYGARSSRSTRNPFELFEGQLQQTTRIGRHQLIVGHQMYRMDKGRHCAETISFEALPDSFGNQIDATGHDRGTQTYVRDDIQLTRWLHATFGVAYQQLTYDDMPARKFDVEQWSPRAGLAIRLTPTTFLRAAGFRHLHINLFSASIAPPTVAGFVMTRNEFPTATRNEYSLSLEKSANRVFVAVRGIVRQTEVPYLLEGGDFIPEADADATGGSVYVNWIAHRRITIFGEDQLLRFGARRFDRYDNLARLGVNVIHPRGLFVRAALSHVTQRFMNTIVPGLPRSGFNLADLQVGYEFAGKRGMASVRLNNAFNTRFDAIIEGISIDPFLPRRSFIASLRWRLW